MLDKIKLGSSINVKVTKTPTNAAATKTIKRVLSKSPDVRAEQNRLEKVRVKQYNPQRRGGRMYGGRMVKIDPIKAIIGDQGTITATMDVINDLKSVSRFIEVTPSK